jgi:hypothetical protein
MDPAPYLTIQSLVDENRESMPMGLAVDLMNECQKAHIAQPKLYKLTWTVVDANAQVHCEEDDTHAEVQLSHKTQTLIVEAVDHLPPVRHNGIMVHGTMRMESVDMPNHGMVLSSWMGLDTPHTIEDYRKRDRLVIIHNIVPYKKRAHE